MAQKRKKNSVSKASGVKKNSKKNLQIKKDIQGIVILAFGILLILGLYYNKGIGIISNVLAPFIFGLFGLLAYFIPLSVAAYGVYLLFSKENFFVRKQLLYLSFLFIITAALIHALFIDFKNYENMKPFIKIAEFYKDGMAKVGGGLFGGLISMPLLSLFQKTGTIIVLISFCIIDILLITKWSPSNTIHNLKEKSVENIKTRKLKRAEEKKKREIELENIITAPSNLKKTDRPKIINLIVGDEEKPDKKKKVKKAKKETASSDIDIPGLNNINKNKAGATKAKKETGNSDNTKKDYNIEIDTLFGKDKVKNEKSKDDFKVFEKTSEVSDYRYPPLSLLNSNKTNSINDKEYRVAAINRAKKLEEILQSFGVDAKVVNICRGPSVTRFELQPKAGIKVSKIVNLADDISLGMATSGVRIEAPIPGKAAIGVEIPNKKVSPVVVKDVIGSSVFKTAKSSISFAMGFDISGDTIIADIAKMPHLLIAGATGAGKSVCINCLITSILYKSSPDEVKVLMIDPKVVELGVYNGIPHLLIPVVTDPKKAAAALNWAVTEMEDRYTKFAELGVRNIETYNKAIKKKYEISMEQEKGKKDKAENEQAPDFMPKIVIIIDELSDLMMVAPNDVEDAICRLAQMARAAGMHLVIATQRPSVNVITGVIKANIPTRISFAVSSQIDSRTILDMAGAEKLLGKGDMLYLPVGRQKPIRLQGAFISESEVENIVEYVKDKKAPDYDEDIIEEINSDKAEHGHGVKEEEWDEVLPKAVELVIDMGQASVSLIQRKFKVGYARAARIIDQMEDRGIVGSFEGSKPRNVLISKQEWQEMQTSSREV